MATLLLVSTWPKEGGSSAWQAVLRTEPRIVTQCMDTNKPVIGHGINATQMHTCFRAEQAFASETG